MAERLLPPNWLFLAGFVGSSLFVGLLAGVDPRFAIAASIAIAFVLIVIADLTVGLAFFGFFSFLELIQFGGVLSVSKLAGTLLAVAWMAFVFTQRDPESDFLEVHPAMSLVLGLLLGWVLLSSLWAESASTVLGQFGRLLPNVILVLIVFSAVRSRRQAMIVIGGFLAGAVAAGVYGLVFSTATGDIYGGRLTGSNLDPNQLASVLVAGIALSAGLALSIKRQPLLRLGVVAAGGFCFIAAIQTGSRGGILALASMLVAAILFGGRWRPQVAIASVLIAGVSFFYIATIAPAEIRNRIQTATQGEERQTEGRSTLWEIGQRIIKAHPVNGVGAGNFQTSSVHYLLQPGAVYRSDAIIENQQVVHNTYLEIGAELGIVGLVLFGSMMVFSVGSSLRAARNFSRRRDFRSEALARSVAVAMVAVLVADIFISQTYNKQLWLMLGLGPAILAVSNRRSAEDEQR
jgi:O-antigen ligase